MADRRLKISRGGQVSLPAPVRKRWQTSTVVAEDHGDRLVLRPAPDDPIEAVFGVFAGEIREGPSLSKVRREAREDERAAEERRRR